MSGVWDYIADELDAESVDLIGVGASREEHDNQWFYRTSKGLSDAGVEPVEHWLGYQKEHRDYDLTGNLFEISYDNSSLQSEASILVAPRPSIYGGNGSYNHFSNYTSMARLVEEDLDTVIMCEVGKDIERKVFETDKEDVSQYFIELDGTEFPLDELEAFDLADIIKRDTGLDATHIRSERLDEEMILVQ